MVAEAVGTEILALIILGQVLFGVVIALFSGPGPAALVEMFPTNVRYSALGISYNLAVALFGGTAPFIATFLISRTGNNLSPGFYLIAAVLEPSLGGALKTSRKGVGRYKIRVAGRPSHAVLDPEGGSAP